MRLRFTWILEKRIAISSIPRLIKDIEVWKEEGVKAVLILVEDHELYHFGGTKNYLELLKRKNFDVYHLPIRDFDIPTIDQCLNAVKWVDEKLDEKKPVVIHCYGGLGRSGTIAACVLVYRYGFRPETAIQVIRNIMPRSLESPRQTFFVYEFYDSLRNESYSSFC